MNRSVRPRPKRETAALISRKRPKRLLKLAACAPPLSGPACASSQAIWFVRRSLDTELTIQGLSENMRSSCQGTLTVTQRSVK
jgi:hypothetical protein